MWIKKERKQKMPNTEKSKKTKILSYKRVSKTTSSRSTIAKREKQRDDKSPHDSQPTKTIIKIIDGEQHCFLVRTLFSLLKNIRVIIRFCLIAIVAGIVGVIFIINNTDPNNYRDDIENYIEFTTGKRAEIKGDLRWKIFSFEPAIKVENLVIKNDSWSSNPDFITADTIIATISLKNLFSHKITINTVIFDTPKIYVDVSKNGRRNWLLPTKNLLSKV